MHRNNDLFSPSKNKFLQAACAVTLFYHAGLRLELPHHGPCVGRSKPGMPSMDTSQLLEGLMQALDLHRNPYCVLQRPMNMYVVPPPPLPL
jgi:hypothetical protein